MKITEDFIGNETKELAKTKIATILRWWGFDPDSYSTWGNARVDMNNILSGASSSTISDRERASSFLSKINYINDTDTVISDTLFAANEPGVWYDPSDLSTLFQDSAGTTPVTAVEQPVGLMLDKSKGLVLGPELVTNGTFDTNLDGWLQPNGIAWSWVSDRAACNTTTNRFLERPLSLPANTTVLFSFEIKQRTSGRVRLRLRNSGGTVAGFGFVQDAKVYSGVLNTGSGVTVIDIEPEFGVGFVGTIDNISVRELPGNHAYQTTATSRPVLSARVNLLTKTEQFEDAVWAKNGVTVTPNTATAPDGTLTADQVGVTTANTSAPSIGVSGVTSAGITYKYSVWLRADVPTTVILQIPNADFTTYLAQQSAAVGTDWKQFSLTFTGQAGGIWHRGGAVGQIYNIWGADLRVANNGANLPPYQRVNTATDYDTAGFPHYLRFDGVDDWLVTPTITPGIDKVQVFAGVRKLSGGTVCLTELSDSVSNAGSFVLGLGAFSLSQDSFAINGTSISTATSGENLSPDSAVWAGMADIGGTHVFRKNAAQKYYAAGPVGGTGNYLAYPLYIGRRGGTTLPFNGHLYSLIVRFGSNLPIATIEKTEKYINQKTRAY